MFTIWYSNRPQRKPQLARYSIRLASALLTKRVNGSAGWRDSLRVASGGSERVKIVALMHLVNGMAVRRDHAHTRSLSKAVATDDGTSVTRVVRNTWIKEPPR
jgi:hypothetical protein